MFLLTTKRKESQNNTVKGKTKQQIGVYCLEAANIDKVTIKASSRDSVVRKRAIGVLDSYIKDNNNDCRLRRRCASKRRKVYSSSIYSFDSTDEDDIDNDKQAGSDDDDDKEDRREVTHNDDIKHKENELEGSSDNEIVFLLLHYRWRKEGR